MHFQCLYTFTLILFSQNGLGLDPLHAGLVFTPTAALFMASALVGHRLVARWGTRPIVAGALLTSASLGAVAVLVAMNGAHTSALVLTLVAAGMGPGNGLVLPSLIGTALLDVPGQHAGAAAGALTTVQQFAASAAWLFLGRSTSPLRAPSPVRRGTPTGWSGPPRSRRSSCSEWPPWWH